MRRRRRSHRRRRSNPSGLFTFALVASGLVVALFLLKKLSAPAAAALPPKP